MEEEYTLNRNETVNEHLEFIKMLIEMKTSPSFNNLASPCMITILMNENNSKIYNIIVNEIHKPVIRIDNNLTDNEMYINISSQFKYIQSSTVLNAVELQTLAKKETKIIKINIE